MVKRKSASILKARTKYFQKQSILKYLYPAIKMVFSRPFIRVSVSVTLIVWTLWLILAGPERALGNLVANWKAAVTMIFGSIVAGGTSMGGGAVAFPVFTKVLEVPPQQAKIFSLAIQSVGMSAALLTIVAMKARVEWRFVRWASLGGIPGIIIGAIWFSPVLPSNFIKFSFTMMVSSFGIVLLALNRTKVRKNLTVPVWTKRERVISVLAGIWGGIVSGMVGSGMDIFGFSVLVLLFGLCEKVSTATSVILMAINAVIGFGFEKYVIGNFSEPVVSYWLAAVPVVVVGAPFGAMLCSWLKPKTIRRIVIGLICIELVSSLLLISLNATLIYFSLFVFVLFSAIYYWMYKNRIYIRKKKYPSSH